MVQWDKDSCADAGFLKIDLLGLGMLSAVERCVELIARERGERVDLSRIPFDDPDTFAAIQNAETTGVFQIESRAQMQSLQRSRPENLDDLTVQVAIVRPGPIQGGAVNPYIERRQRLRVDPDYEIPYDHPSLEPILRETLGTIIFQDQVIEVAQAFAGFSAGEADGLRRAMSRKRADAAIEHFRRRFVAGAAAHVGADEPTAERVWQMVSGFAGFGFPKSHSAAFGLLAYQSTWLRVHYAPEFLCALLNEQPMGFYAPDSLVHEAQRRGIAVLGVDINASDVECTRASAGRCGSASATSAASARPRPRRLSPRARRAGRFATSATSPRGRARGGRALEQLAWSGACDALAGAGAAQAGSARRLALWQLGVAAPGRPARRRHPAGAADRAALGASRCVRSGAGSSCVADYSTSGVTVGDHVMAALRRRLRVPMLATSAQLERMPHGCSVAIAGLVIARQRPGTAKGIVFLLFEDEWGTVNLIVPPDVYERQRRLVRTEPLLLARGRLERPAAGNGIVNVLVREFEALDPALAEDGVAAETHPLHNQADGTPPAQEDDGEAGGVGASMRAVAPPIQSFASGRRR